MISVLTPTRGRPHNMRRMVDSGRATATGEIEYVFYIDEDDKLSEAMADELIQDGRADITYVSGPRIVLSDMWNYCQKISHGEIMMLNCDETVFRTGAWDFHVTKAFREWDDRIGLVYGRDGIHDERLATHPFTSREWTDALGYFTPVQFRSDWADQWQFDLASMIGRLSFLPDVYTEHMHPVVGKAPYDRTHEERFSVGSQEGLYRSLMGKRSEDAQKLLKAIEDAK